jgi:hypothetical protein
MGCNLNKGDLKENSVLEDKFLEIVDRELSRI